MRKHARKDANQDAIVEALRDCGASVWVTSQLGNGAPDVVVGIAGRAVLVEIKDGAKPPSERRLTPLEQAFRSSWRGPYEVVSSVDEALQLYERLRRSAA